MRDSLFEVDPELKVPKFFPIFCVEDTPSRFIKQINFPLHCEVAMGIRLKQVQSVTYFKANSYLFSRKIWRTVFEQIMQIIRCLSSFS